GRWPGSPVTSRSSGSSEMLQCGATQLMRMPNAVLSFSRFAPAARGSSTFRPSLTADSSSPGSRPALPYRRRADGLGLPWRHAQLFGSGQARVAVAAGLAAQGVARLLQDQLAQRDEVRVRGGEVLRREPAARGRHRIVLGAEVVVLAPVVEQEEARALPEAPQGAATAGVVEVEDAGEVWPHGHRVARVHVLAVIHA